MRYRWLGLFVGLAVVALTGGRPAQTAWAVEARFWHDGLREAQLAEGGRAYAKYLAPDVVWDDSASYAEDARATTTVGYDAIELAAWALGPESLRLEPEIFISVDGLVDFFHYDWRPLGQDFRTDTREPAHGVSLMAPIGPLGAGSLVNGMAIEDWRDRRPRWPEADEAEAVASSWTSLWSGATDDVDILYRNGARVLDSIAGIDLTGRPAIAELAATAGSWEVTTVTRDRVRGVYPLVRRTSGTRKLEEVVLVVSGEDTNGCRGEMVVWLVLDQGFVIEEIRYWPIERARRCLPAAELPNGWWTDRDVPAGPAPPPEDIDTPTDPVIVGGGTICIYNGTPNLNRLLAWGIGRFEAVGLTPPTIASATFTLYADLCEDLRARYHPTSTGGNLSFCFDEQAACWDPNCVHFTPTSRRLVLHELAHGWMDESLDDIDRQRFTDHLGLEVWSDQSVIWRERAMEHAAETITWGLMDREMNMVLLGSPGPEHLTESFRMLTGTDPLPKVDDYSPPPSMR